MKTLQLGIIALLLATIALADGKVTAPAPPLDPVATWVLLEVHNYPTPMATATVSPKAVREGLTSKKMSIVIAYLRQSGAIDSTASINLNGEQYYAAIASLGQVADAAVESTLTRVNALGQTVPDVAAISNFRLSKYLQSINQLPGTVTVEKVK